MKLKFINKNLIETKQDKKLYKYDGNVYRFGKYLGETSLETWAVSLKKAINNFIFKAAAEFGYDRSAGASIDIDVEDIIEVDTTNSNQNTLTNKPKCPVCGQILNDAGECPLCDLGDESVLDENIELHDQLNPKLWDEEHNLLQPVKDKIIEIAEAFKKQLSEDGVYLKTTDIYLLGSNANYNYNEDSDLDIHLIADESDDCLQQHLPIIYQAYKSLFNNKYNITIKGINVELYVENKDKLTNVSTGVYSLSNGWIKQPSRYSIPEIDEFELQKRVQFWEDKYYDITAKPSIDRIDNYIDAIYSIRQDSISNEGEFGIDNLVFKEIRRLGYLDQLKELKTNIRSRELSLNEEFDNKKRELYRQELSRISFNQAIIQDNGLFHIYNVRESDVSRIINRINQLDYVTSVSKIAGKYDFNNVVKASMGNPDRYWTITGHIKIEK